jgi:class 3 adenylate cyclase/tetratricopeptide (TPR) repeat protein
VAEGGTGQPRGESRTETILFTDLVGSTALRSRLGDDAADGVMHTHEHACTTAVGEHSGTVVKVLGDGVFAAFGAAADAVAAAEAIQQLTHRANQRSDDTRRLEVRVGLSAGDVAWDGDDLHGTPVVTAARLCDRAEGGEILCDDLVRGLARGRSRATFRMVGEVELKGLDDPVVAYQIPWQPAGLEAAPLPALLLPVPGQFPFAGRDEERDAMLLYWKSAQTDGRTVALVSGEPGMGKTRLTSEVARSAHSEGAWVLAGRCDESVAAPFTPWLELLRHVVAHAPDDVLHAHTQRHGGELTRLVPELARRVPGIPEPRPLDPESERLALFDAALDVLTGLAETAPVFLVIDDAHWADTASLDLLRHLSRRLPIDAHVLVVVTYRDTDVDRAHPLQAMLGDLRREPRVERIPLHGITEEGLCALLTAAGGEELEEEGFELARTLARETEGNPFFIGEVITHLMESGLIVHRDGRWQGTISVDQIGIPEGIRDVVGRRLSRLSDKANDTLRTAAVVGRDFSLAVVADVTGESEDDLLQRVEEALRAQLVHEVPDAPGRMTFAHALVRSTLLEELSTTRRVRLHLKVGEVLERDPRSSAAELAYHFAEAAAAGATEQAVRHGLRAAQEARHRLAYDEAVRFCDMALEAIDAADPDPVARSTLLALRGFVNHERGNYDAGREDGLAAADAARAAGDPALLAEAGLAYQGQFNQWAAPGDAAGIELMREGLAGLGDGDADLLTRARILAALSGSLTLTANDEALALAEEADRIASQVGDDEALLSAMTSLMWGLRGKGRNAELCEVGARASDLAATTRRISWEVSLRYLYGVGLVGLGRIDEAEAEFERSIALPTVLAGWAPFRSTLALVHGNLDDAARLADEAHAHGGAIGDTNDAVYAGQRMRIAFAAGRFDEAAEWIARGRETTYNYDPFEALLALEAGDHAHARRVTDQYEQEGAPALSPVVLDYTVDARVRLALAFDDRELAARVGVYAAPFVDQLVGTDNFLDGAGENPLGLIALIEGRLDDAVALLERAVVVVEELQLEVLVATHQVDLSRALLARAGARDADRAKQLLTDAAAAAEAMGFAPLARTARELLA